MLWSFPPPNAGITFGMIFKKKKILKVKVTVQSKDVKILQSLAELDVFVPVWEGSVASVPGGKWLSGPGESTDYESHSLQRPAPRTHPTDPELISTHLHHDSQSWLHIRITWGALHTPFTR